MDGEQRIHPTLIEVWVFCGVFDKIKVTDTATVYALNTERNTYRFYKEYPEAKPEPEFKENTNLIGFSIDDNQEDDEEEFEEDRMGFR